MLEIICTYHCCVMSVPSTMRPLSGGLLSGGLLSGDLWSGGLSSATMLPPPHHRHLWVLRVWQADQQDVLAKHISSCKTAIYPPQMKILFFLKIPLIRTAPN